MQLRKTIILIGSLLVLLAASGCSANGLQAELAAAERNWQSQEIASYRIEVAHTSSLWHSQTHSITVRDGQVVDFEATCVTAPMESALGKECQVESYDPQDFTVPGLFALAHALLEDQPAEALAFSFDPAYGYPNRIVFDLPDVLDEDQSWAVRAFQPLED